MRKGVYRCRSCLHETTVTRGTIFYNTKKLLQMWFMAVWYVVNQKNGVSTLGLQKVLGLGSYHTAWSWKHKPRTAMVRPGRYRLSGIVEIDETFVTGEYSSKRGRGRGRQSTCSCRGGRDRIWYWSHPFADRVRCIGFFS